MAVHVGEPYPRAGTLPRAEQRAEYDAALSANQKGESALGGSRRDSLGERTRVSSYGSFIARAAGRALEIHVWWRPDVAEVIRSHTLGQLQLAEDRGGTVDLAHGATIVVGSNSDARRSADQRDRAAGVAHGQSHQLNIF
jgi:hypothetical protein